MPKKCTKVEQLAEIVFTRKAAGETNREIAESYGLTLNQIKEVVSGQNHKARKIAQGCIPRPKGRPRKTEASEEIKRSNELAQLRMQVELLQSFLSELGKR